MPDQAKIDLMFRPLDATDFGQSYFLSLGFTPQIADVLEDTVMAVAREIGDGLYVQPARSLHVSVLDFIDAVIDPAHHGYVSKAALWQKIGPQCDAAIRKALKNVGPFTIHFSELVVTDAAIILKGEDSGQLQRIRHSIMDDIGSLRLPRTKQPPTIIHATVARYAKEMPLEPIRRAAAAQLVAFVSRVDCLYLRHQTKINLLEYTDLTVYNLPQV